MRFISSLILLLSLTLAGCISMPTQEEMAKAEYGTPPPEKYEGYIRAFMENRLVDPYSAVYQFGKASKGAALLWRDQDGHENPGGWNYGYLIPVNINAKNRMGGYTGEKSYHFFIKNSDIFVVDFTSGSIVAK